ncbi:hypothetical protein PL373_13400 [Tenacibaculum maritimum]|nr:hypothetical protein [Tenacibaculum maritimum]MDB0602125.1 hypothetical protein [Tenacibaculum maritimum]MDB0613800.1 hypothetical protein [Tenacibaculum maritimum]
MKKLIILSLSIILLFSCSSDDDSSNDTNSLFNPPSWIIGTWENETVTGGTTQILRYVFSSNNVIEEVIQNGQTLTSINYSEFYNHDFSTVTETINSNSYLMEFEVTTNSQTISSSKEFQKSSDTEIQLIQSGITTGVTFTKQ